MLVYFLTFHLCVPNRFCVFQSYIVFKICTKNIILYFFLDDLILDKANSFVCSMLLVISSFLIPIIKKKSMSD